LRILSNELVEVKVDEGTGNVVGLKDLITGSEHLLSRRPELKLRRTGMGIAEIEPFQCPQWREVGEGKFLCSQDGVEVEKRVKVEGPRVLYAVKARNSNPEPREVRVRVAIYSACSRGGFWGDPGVEGASHACRYYVSFGFGESWGTFSNVATPGTARGFPFRKHSYRTRWFPELKWIALVDKAKREGLAIRCISRGCYGAVEDQFFDVEVNLAIPEAHLKPGEEVSLEFQLLPFHGLGRVDHVGERFLIGVEVPSVVLPGERMEGVLRIYPLVKGEGRVEGEMIMRRGMQSIGKRGYNIDRVKEGVRTLNLEFSPEEIAVSPLTPTEVKLRTSREMEWSFERELYEVPYLSLRVLGEEVRRAISVNPDVMMALRSVGAGLRDLVARYVEDNPAVESDYLDREASSHIYSLARDYSFRPAKLFALPSLLDEATLQLLRDYLKRRGIQEISKALGIKAIQEISPLDLALGFKVYGSLDYLDAMKTWFRLFCDLVEREEFATYYRALHGGAGADRFSDYVLALDLVEDQLGEDLVSRTYRAFRWVAKEVEEITNAWTGNWELGEAAGLLALAGKLRYQGYEQDVERALNVARISLSTFLEDGAWPELSASYHTVTLSHLIRLAELSRVLGLEDLYSFNAGGEAVIVKALKWLWGVLTPSDRTPAMEDAGESSPPPDIFFIASLRYGDPRFAYAAHRLSRLSPLPNWPLTALIALQGNLRPERGTPWVRERVSVFPQSGRFVYRDSEAEDSLYLILDFGPQGGWHGHADRLNFELHYLGQPLVVDAGVAGYYNPLHWTWSRRSIAHNTVTRGEEDHDEYSRGELLDLRTSAQEVRAVFVSRIDRGAEVRRELSLRPGEGVLDIRDVVTGEGRFRFNIHCRGSHRDLGRGKHQFSLGGFSYLLVLPEGANEVVREGYRGREEKVPYIYYERDVKGSAEFQARVQLKGERLS